MSETMTDTSELHPYVERVGDHLLDQVERRNPLLANPTDSYGASVIVAYYTGSERAFDLAWDVVETDPNFSKQLGWSSFYTRDFVNALIKYHGEEGADDVITLSESVSLCEDPEGFQSELLTIATEALKEDKSLRSVAANMAVSGLRKIIEKDPHARTEDSYTYPSDLLLRIGIADNRPELVAEAAAKLPESAYADFISNIVEALQKGVDPELHDALIEAAVVVQGKGSVHTSHVSGGQLRDLLSHDEMKRILSAYHQDGKRPLWPPFRSVFRRKSSSPIIFSGYKDLRDFNALTSEFDAWVNPSEHARFAITAIRRRIHESQYVHYRTPKISSSEANRYAEQIMKMLDEYPNLVIEKAGPFAQIVDTTDMSIVQPRAKGFFDLGYLISEIGRTKLAASGQAALPGVYELRDRLPRLSSPRVMLNGALAKAGDQRALIDSAEALTSDPRALLTEAARPIEDYDHVDGRAVDLHTYDESFFSLATAA